MCDEFDTSSVARANDTERPPSYGFDMTTNTKGGVMKIKGSRRLVARLGLALAVAAIVAPGAQAMPIDLNDGGGSYSVRHYADDLHASLPVVTMKASNVRTDASSIPSSMPGANVSTDSVSFQGEPRSNPAANVRTDASSPFRPVPSLVNDFVNVQTDAASSVSTTDARHTALLRHRAQLGQEPVQLASTPLPSTDSPGIDWGVAAIGAALGALGLMLLFGIVYYAGRHNRSRLAAT